MSKYELFYYTESGKSPFNKWFQRLARVDQYRVESRLDRLEVGNLGDYKNIDRNLFELRFSFGGGIRVYFCLFNSRKILILLGGNKSSQNQDIKKAKQYFNSFRYGSSN